MAKNTEKKQRDSKEKLELAQKIADNSQKVVNTYANVENAVVYFFRRVMGGLNKLIFDSKFSKIAALLIAIIIYVAVNADNTTTLNVTQASQINDIPVQVMYNSEIYEISGIPEKANVIVTGDMSDITLQKSQTNSRLTADLSGLTEGTYSIKLTPSNFISRLTVNVLDTPTVTVTIKKKTTTRFNISYEFINTNSMDSIYSLSEPTFDQTEVLIRASHDTIEGISFVKALIDVTGVNDSFTKASKVVAYDQNGNRVACDIIPDTVQATVAVSSPNKTVPIIVRPVGTLPDNLAIDDISIDYSTVTVYAPNSVLDTINAFYIDLDVSGITKNTAVSTALTVPSGANKISVTKINMDITVAASTSRIIEDVPLEWFNNTSEYRFGTVNTDDSYMDVIVKGTENNIKDLTVQDVKVEFDASGLSLGIQEVPLIVTGNNQFVSYSILDGRTSVEIQVVANS